MTKNLENFVYNARRGDKESLDKVIDNIKDLIFGLSVRMLGDPIEAEDAVQEILIKIVTNLANFRGESAFTTWVYSIAANHLLTVRRKKSRHNEVSFDEFGDEIDRYLEQKAEEEPPREDADYFLRLEEMWISCTQGMLLCLSRGLRLAYILGDVFHMNSDVSAEVMGISKPAYRKRLSRARDLLFSFMKQKCSLVNPDSPCTCPKQIFPDCSSAPQSTFTSLACRARTLPEVKKRMLELDEMKRVGEIFRSHPDYQAPDNIVRELKNMLGSGNFEILEAR